MSNKFEQLLDLIVNEETEKANELFHEIVVEKSREIYENLIAEEEEEEEETSESMDCEEEEETKESITSEEEEEEEEATNEGFGDGEEEEEDPFATQDQSDDLEGDVVDHDAMAAAGQDDEEGGSEPATKGDIDDLADALEELKSEFERLMSAEEHEEEEEPGIHGEPGLLGGEEEEEGPEAPSEEEESFNMESSEEEEEDDSMKSEGQRMREYIERVSVKLNDGDVVGAGTGEKISNPVQGKSPISSGKGKPTTGADAKNILGNLSTHDEDGTSPKGKVGGVLKKGGDIPHAGQFLNTEKSGQKAKGMFSNAKKPAGGEGKPVGAGSGQSNVTGSTNTRSIESGKK